MAKTEETVRLETDIYTATKKLGIYCCYEVTIGIGGNERVDYMTLDSKGIFRCYEIKVSVSDFRSKAKNSFCGHYNYYVMTDELYQKVKDEIPKHVGVYIGTQSKKRAIRQIPLVSEDVLMMSLLRSLSREADKLYKSGRSSYVDTMNATVRRLQRDLEHSRGLFRDLQRDVITKYGRNWHKEEVL
ncbi:hypothetical protein ADM98_11575 [Exiguobacterium sp. BMC-KP]|uniref:MmcB family DNA repair protein n=1 Tax=Exiguobacterium sp. BMC-KP TaxID=1684312 RepID=UPI0006AA38BF|nr:MmcB family DNA repair protein [Exiguobacterium sp. BMC-KP]KOP29503.1 hypothetical protein ADM98_11575 [Exiguobacterium sp. BMC-KP]